MSAPRNRREMKWTDDAGNEYSDSWRTPDRGTSLASIPKELHLVDAYCDNRHLTAVLIDNGSSSEHPVAVHRPSGPPGAAYELVADGLVPTLEVRDGHGGGLRTPLGLGPMWVIGCPSCQWPDNKYELNAQQLHKAVANGEKRIGLRRGEGV